MLWTDNWQCSQKRMRSFPIIESHATSHGEGIRNSETESLADLAGLIDMWVAGSFQFN